MKPPEEIKRELVNQWLAKANQDLTAAQILLSSGAPLLSIVGFHAQQAAEKYLKAYLTLKQIDVPKTHNIATLIVIISEVNQELASKLMLARILSDYAVQGRYPGDLPDLSNEDVATAIRLAQQVRDAILRSVEEAF